MFNKALKKENIARKMEEFGMKMNSNYIYVMRRNFIGLVSGIKTQSILAIDEHRILNFKLNLAGNFSDKSPEIFDKKEIQITYKKGIFTDKLVITTNEGKKIKFDVYKFVLFTPWIKENIKYIKENLI